MNTDIDSVLGRIRPRDRQRVDSLLQGILGPETATDLTRVTVSRVGGGGDGIFKVDDLLWFVGK